ncbi:hypothetical protein OCU04_010048 [Sclerotinia nivalis]|uniref:Uncharacterized protein n=1 Tax=Sclerotinia nivalis TaxID=352851 RepID=A0A9X0AEN4_9HELO|nr:hypothetical protein OCU04_010048 [Sclerotinia nivalis]
MLWDEQDPDQSKITHPSYQQHDMKITSTNTLRTWYFYNIVSSRTNFKTKFDLAVSADRISVTASLAITRCVRYHCSFSLEQCFLHFIGQVACGSYIVFIP